jgi:hypothetical protein
MQPLRLALGISPDLQGHFQLQRILSFASPPT